MKRIVFFLIISLVFTTNMALAQEPAPKNNAEGETECPILFPLNLIGVRGGLNLADMVYSFDPIDIYRHYLQPQGMVGLFGHFHLGKSNLAIRPEVTFIGRADNECMVFHLLVSQSYSGALGGELVIDTLG